MLSQQVTQAGKEAIFARESFGAGSPEHDLSIKKIDDLAASWRELEPNKFWSESDPVYQKMRADWAKDRLQRKVTRPLVS